MAATEALKFASSHARNDAPTYYLIATNAVKSYNDPTTPYDSASRRHRTAAVQRASMSTRYMEAMVYYNLLPKKAVDLDPKKKDYWTSLADEWRNKAMALREKSKTAASAPSPTKTAP
jgi:hypothetical protein